MEKPIKRKRDDADASRSNHPKRGRGEGAGAGKWLTPQHKARVEATKRRSLEVGDVGLMVTCQKHKERTALDELVGICETYGEKLYGIKPEATPEPLGADDKAQDIESSIQRELEAMKSSKPKKQKGDAVFEPVILDMDCILFVKTRSPVDPVHFAREICLDAAKVTGKREWRSRFINRITPISHMVRATEAGVEEVARKVLAPHFQLKDEADDSREEKEGQGCSYAIRPTFRAHSTLKRSEVIDKVAALIGPRHKVNLTTPDKCILIDVYKTFCGMSVVDGDWNEELKKYNIFELYMSASKKTSAKPKES